MIRLITRLSIITAILTIFAGNVFAQKVCLVGAAADTSGLPLAEKNAYGWALSHFGADAAYISFANIGSSGLPADCQAIWFHFEDDPILPADAAFATSAIEAFVSNGGGLLVSGFATEYAVAINATGVSPDQTINNDPAGPDAAWGIKPFPGFENHPVFAGLTANTDWADPNWSGFRTISDSVAGREAIRWWTGGSFPGTGLGTMPWFGGIDLPVVGEIPKGQGNVMVATAPGYNWISAAINGANEQANLEQFTANMLNYLIPNPSIILIGAPSDTSGLSTSEKNAYSWALSHYGKDAVYQSFSDVAANGLPASVKVAWFHLEDDANIPSDAGLAAAAIEAFIDNGGGMFLSSFATGYVVDVNATTVAPSQTINNNPAGPDAAWGIKPFAGFENHPIFAGIPATTDWADPNWSGFRTISDSVAGHEAVRWWTGGSFPGTGFGTMPWFGGTDLPVTGEIPKGKGNIMITSAPGYQWLPTANNGANEQTNLEKFTENILTYLQPEPSLVMLGSANSLSDLPQSEKNAYSWAQGAYGFNISYRSFADIQADGLPASTEVVWYHLEDVSTIPTEALAVADSLKNFVSNGGGMLLSGFATAYANNMDTSIVAPNQIIDNDPAGPDAAWGIKPFAGFENHPVFANIPATTDWADPNWSGFRTISDSVAGHEAISWWTGGSFPGTGFGTMPWFGGTDLPAVGEILIGNGGVVAASAPGYQWLPTANNGASDQANLEQFTRNMLEYLFTVNDQQTLVVSHAGGPIQEGDEAGKVLDVTVTNAIFTNPLTQGSWVIKNLPGGISAAVSRVDDTHASLTLSGTATDYDVDITDFTVEIPSSEFLNLKTDTISSVGGVVFDAIVEVVLNPGKIAVLGTAATLTQIEPNARKGYEWAKREFGDTAVVYYSFQDVILDSTTLLANFRAAWWHYESFETLPILADNENVSRILRRFREESGGGILLSGTATQYVVNLGLEPNNQGMQVTLAPVASNPDHWGFRIKTDKLNHPAFANLNPVFFTLFTTGTRENPLSWWVINPNDPNYATIPVPDRFHGTHLAGPEWDSNFDILVSLAEYEGAAGEGSAIAVGAGAFDWYIPDGVNADSADLQTLTFNILNYLKTSGSVGIYELEENVLGVQAFPNPFKDEVNIRFTLDKTMPVSIQILDISGRKVDVLVSGQLTSAGTQVIKWQANRFDSGMYFYQIKAGNQIVNGKIILQR
ncbi:MAG: DUF4960 domain-containing protein [Bacteroidia bacterium]|nr:DUF4960 domain-containing protein [Bacteroidia bacterium]